MNLKVLFLKYEWFICVDRLFISMFWGVSNYSFRPMEKTYFRILLFLVFITSLCNSQDYTYDENYNYYNENYDYTDDYSQELNDYYGNQNLLAPAPSPIPPPFIPPPPLPATPPPPPPQPGNYIIVC